MAPLPQIQTRVRNEAPVVVVTTSLGAYTAHIQSMWVQVSAPLLIPASCYLGSYRDGLR